MTTTKHIAVIGLGSMGYGIAKSLLRAGHQVYGYDLNQEQVQKVINEGGHNGNDTVESKYLDAAVVVVLSSTQMETVLFGPKGIVHNMKTGSVVVACTTVSPAFAKEMEAKCKAVNVYYLDAPISGGSIKAADGNLSIMAAGTPAAFTAARPVLEATADTIFELGDEAGAGSAMKAVNQLLAGVHIAAMAEALTFGMTQGIEPKQFLEVISKCAGTSWMLENRAPHITKGDYTPHSAIDIWPKDLGIVLEIAESVNFRAPIAAAALQRFTEASNSGLGSEDDAAVAKIYADEVNLKLPGQ